MKRILQGCMLMVGLALLAASCGKKGDPTVPVAPKLLPIANVNAQLSAQGVTLSWIPPTEYDTKKSLDPDDIRSFTIYRQLQTPAANTWQFSQSAEGWRAVGETLPVKPYSGTLRTESSDPYVRIHSPENVDIDAGTYRYLRLKIWTKNCQEGYVLFITSADKTWDKNFDSIFQPSVHTSSYSFQKAFDTIKTKAFSIETTPSVTAAEYLIDMQSLPSWIGKVSQVGLIFKKRGEDSETAEIAVESVEFLPSLIERASVYNAPPYLFLDDEEGWNARGTTLFGAADGALYARGTSPILLTSKPGQQLAAKDAQFVRIRMLASDGGEAYLVAHDNPLTSIADDIISPERPNVVRIPLVASPEWNTYDLDLRGMLIQPDEPDTETPTTAEKSGTSNKTTVAAKESSADMKKPATETLSAEEKQSGMKAVTQLGLFFPKRANGTSRQIAIDFIDAAGSETQSASRITMLKQAPLPPLETIARHIQAAQRTAGMVFDVAYDEIPAVRAAASNESLKLDVMTPKDARQPDGSYAFTDTGAFEVGEKEDKQVATLDEGARYSYQIEMMDRKKRKSTLSTGTVVEIVKPLMPPRDLRATPGDRTAELSWNPPLLTTDGKKARHVSEYRIFRAETVQEPSATPTITPTAEKPAATPTAKPAAAPKIGNLPATQIVALPAAQTNFIDQNLTNGVEYLYAVEAISSAASDPSAQMLSNSVSVTPLDTFAPTAPNGLVGVYLGKTVNLHWSQAQVGDFAGFNVYRSEQKESGFERLNDEPILNATYEDATAQEKKRYYYRVTTIDDETPPNESEPAVTLVETYLLD